MLREEEQMSLFGQDTWSGKTSPELSQATVAKTSQPSSKKRSGSQSRKPPLFLCLTKDGPQADASMMWTDGGALRGEYSMHSFGESPKEGVESRLSQILEDSPHPRFSLSAKACQGILNRANRRGKKLPEPLERALLNQSLALSKSEEAVVGGKGALVQEDMSATLSTLQDQTLFQPIGFAYKAGAKAGSTAAGEDKSPTLFAERHDAAVCYGISSFHSNGMLSSNPHSGIYEAETARTLDALNCGYPGCNQGGMMVVQAVDARNGTEGDVNGTLQAKSNGGISYNCNNLVRVGTE